MGRGRQKAKQTKVARELKYYTPETDFKSLERELSGKTEKEPSVPPTEDLDEYGNYQDWSTKDD